MLLYLPQEIWEMAFDLLPGQDLQSISKIPRLRVILEVARSSMHKLQLHRAGMVDLSVRGSSPLAERSELLKTHRTRWESLRWTRVTCLRSKLVPCPQFIGTTLVRAEIERPVVTYHQLPLGGAPESPLETHHLCLSSRGTIVVISTCPRTNLLAVVIEEWIEGTRDFRIELHIRRLDPARDIIIPHDGQQTVCEPTMVNINQDLGALPRSCTYQIEQTGRNIGILFGCNKGVLELKWTSRFIIWDVITQTQVVNICIEECRSFLFLDDRWVIFGGIRFDFNPDADCYYHPYLKVTDPLTGRSCSTTLELDASITSNGTIAHIRLCSGAEKGLLPGKGAMAFVSDVSRGIICAEVYWHTLGASPTEYNQSTVFLLDIENVLSKVPLSPDLDQRREEWKDLSPFAAVFSYDAEQHPVHRVLFRWSYVAGFSYVSPTQPLDSNNPTGPRCFFVYDFNPHREAPDPLGTPEDPDPETGYRKSASEITREVVGGLSCWKMRFDLPAAVGVEQCHVVLMDGGFALVDSYLSRDHVSITVFSIW